MTDPTNDDRPIRRVSFSPNPITEPAPSGFFVAYRWPALAMALAMLICMSSLGYEAQKAEREIPREACPPGTEGRWVDPITVDCQKVIS